MKELIKNIINRINGKNKSKKELKVEYIVKYRSGIYLSNGYNVKPRIDKDFILFKSMVKASEYMHNNEKDKQKIMHQVFIKLDNTNKLTHYGYIVKK